MMGRSFRPPAPEQKDSMLLETVKLDWVRQRQFVMRDRNGFPILMDQPNGVNAADLLPLSLAGCTSYDVIAILEKQRQEVADLSVTAESMRDPDPPGRFERSTSITNCAAAGSARKKFPEPSSWQRRNTAGSMPR